MFTLKALKSDVSGATPSRIKREKFCGKLIYEATSIFSAFSTVRVCQPDWIAEASKVNTVLGSWEACGDKPLKKAFKFYLVS